MVEHNWTQTSVFQNQQNCAGEILLKEDDNFWIPRKLRALLDARDRAPKLTEVFRGELECRNIR